MWSIIGVARCNANQDAQQDVVSDNAPSDDHFVRNIYFIDNKEMLFSHGTPDLITCPQHQSGIPENSTVMCYSKLPDGSEAKVTVFTENMQVCSPKNSETLNEKDKLAICKERVSYIKLVICADLPHVHRLCVGEMLAKDGANSIPRLQNYYIKHSKVLELYDNSPGAEQPEDENPRVEEDVNTQDNMDDITVSRLASIIKVLVYVHKLLMDRMIEPSETASSKAPLLNKAFASNYSSVRVLISSVCDDTLGCRASHVLLHSAAANGAAMEISKIVNSSSNEEKMRWDVLCKYLLSLIQEEAARDSSALKVGEASSEVAVTQSEGRNEAVCVKQHSELKDEKAKSNGGNKPENCMKESRSKGCVIINDTDSNKKIGHRLYRFFSSKYGIIIVLALLAFTSVTAFIWFYGKIAV